MAICRVFGMFEDKGSKFDNENSKSIPGIFSSIEVGTGKTPAIVRSIPTRLSGLSLSLQLFTFLLMPQCSNRFLFCSTFSGKISENNSDSRGHTKGDQYRAEGYDR